MDSGYESEEIAEVIEEAGYQYVVKAKEYTNLFEKAYDRPVKIWEDYGYQKQAMFVFMKPDKWNKARKFAVVRELKPIILDKWMIFPLAVNYALFLLPALLQIKISQKGFSF